jgi:hypothetical protein
VFADPLICDIHHRYGISAIPTSLGSRLSRHILTVNNKVRSDLLSPQFLEWTNVGPGNLQLLIGTSMGCMEGFQ